MIQCLVHFTHEHINIQEIEQTIECNALYSDHGCISLSLTGCRYVFYRCNICLQNTNISAMMCRESPVMYY